MKDLAMQEGLTLQFFAAVLFAVLLALWITVELNTPVADDTAEAAPAVSALAHEADSSREQL